jgi:hypothetical protein
MKQADGAHIFRRAVRIPRTIAIVLSLLVLTAACTRQEAPRNSQVVDGVAIYLGVVPSQIVRGHPGVHAESTMHGGVPETGRSDHVVVALFEDATGKRIEDAQVSGSIKEMGSDRKKFVRMRIDGTITYGAYILDVPASHDYHLKLWIRRPSNKEAIEATFSHVSLGA